MNHHRILGAAKAGNLETAKIKTNSVGSKFTRVEHKVDAKVGTKFSSPKKVDSKVDDAHVWSMFGHFWRLVDLWSRFGRGLVDVFVFNCFWCFSMFGHVFEPCLNYFWNFDLFCNFLNLELCYQPCLELWIFVPNLLWPWFLLRKLLYFFACTFCASVKIYILMAHLIM